MSKFQVIELGSVVIFGLFLAAVKLKTFLFLILSFQLFIIRMEVFLVGNNIWYEIILFHMTFAWI